jgi:hypothetical protein
LKVHTSPLLYLQVIPPPLPYLCQTKIRQTIFKQGRPTKLPNSGHEASAINEQPNIVRVFVLLIEVCIFCVVYYVISTCYGQHIPPFCLNFVFLESYCRHFFHGQIEFTSFPPRALQLTTTHGHKNCTCVLRSCQQTLQLLRSTNFYTRDLKVASTFDVCGSVHLGNILIQVQLDVPRTLYSLFLS